MHPPGGNIRTGSVFTLRRLPIVPRARCLLLALAVSLLVGCAGDYRREAGLQWVTEQAEERARLEAMGFPQFTGPN